MPATTIFNWLISIFAVTAIAGLIMGIYSVVAHPESSWVGKVAILLCIGGGIVAMICGIVRITLVFAK